jgi:hypothetical protein
MTDNTRACAHEWHESDDDHWCHRPTEHTGPHSCAHCEAMIR